MNLENERKKTPRKRSNPTKDGLMEIKINLTVLANLKEKRFDFKEFSIEPDDELSIADIGTLLGQNVAGFLMQNMKPSSNVKI